MNPHLRRDLDPPTVLPADEQLPPGLCHVGRGDGRRLAIDPTACPACKGRTPSEEVPMPTPDPPDADPAPLWALAAVITLLAILAGVLASHPAGCAVPQFGTGRVP